MKNLTLAGLAAIVLCQIMFSSCTIEKRHYRPGYHIEWKHQVTGSSNPETCIAPEQKSLPGLQEKTSQHFKSVPFPIDQADSSVMVLKKNIPAVSSSTGKVLPGNIIGKIKQDEKKHDSMSKPELLIAPEPAITDTGMFFLAGLMLGAGLFPFVILLYAGAGREFYLDLAVWIAGIAISIFSLIFDSLALAIIGVTLLVATGIYALVIMIQNR